MIKTLACGMRAYAAMNAEPEERVPALNRCGCGKEIRRWSIGRGHECDCGKTCNGSCVR